jgi:ABC-type transport system involved in multi-copper enzyme maturation permease subunit
MNIFQSRKLTDAEYVEKVRKQLQKNRRLAWLWIVVAAIHLFMLIGIIYFQISLLQIQKDVNPEKYKTLSQDISIGNFIGFLIGIWVVV